MKVRPSAFVFLAVLTAVLSTRATQALRPGSAPQLTRSEIAAPPFQPFLPVQPVQALQPIPPRQPGDPAPHRALIDRYFVTCHSDRVKTAGLTLEKRDLSRVPEDAEVWERALRKLRAGMMPPQGMPRPAQSNIDALVSFLETSIDSAALSKPNPGRSPLHRLNRAEYANAIRDLLSLEIDASSLL